MNLQSFCDEFVKIADPQPPSPTKPLPINVSVRGPSLPRPGGLNVKMAAMGTPAMMPRSSDVSRVMGMMPMPKAPRPMSSMPPPTKPTAGWHMAPESLRPTARPSAAPTTPPPSSVVTPRANVAMNTPAETHAPTVMPPPPAAQGMSASSGRAYAAQRAQFAGPRKAPMLMKVGELLKAAAADAGMLRGIAKNLVKHENIHEVAGLGTLAVPSLDNIQARTRATLAGDKGEAAVEKRQFLPEAAHDALEAGGLGYLAAPVIAKKALGVGH